MDVREETSAHKKIFRIEAGQFEPSSDLSIYFILHTQWLHVACSRDKIRSRDHIAMLAALFIALIGIASHMPIQVFFPLHTPHSRL